HGALDFGRHPHAQGDDVDERHGAFGADDHADLRQPRLWVWRGDRPQRDRDHRAAGFVIARYVGRAAQPAITEASSSRSSATKSTRNGARAGSSRTSATASLTSESWPTPTTSASRWMRKRAPSPGVNRGRQRSRRAAVGAIAAATRSLKARAVA